MAAIAFICFLSGLFYYSRLSVERHIREQTVAVAQMVADRIALAFDNTDRLLSSIVGDLQPGDYDATAPTPSGGRSNAQALLARAQAQHRDIHSLTLVDANGHLLAQASGEGERAPPDDKNLPVVGQDDPATAVILTVTQDPGSGAWRPGWPGASTTRLAGPSACWRRRSRWKTAFQRLPAYRPSSAQT
jgi:hypothetical protein